MKKRRKAKENNYFPYYYDENYSNANNFITRENVFRIIYFAKDFNKLDNSNYLEKIGDKYYE